MVTLRCCKIDQDSILMHIIIIHHIEVSACGLVGATVCASGKLMQIVIVRSVLRCFRLFLGMT